LRTTTTVSTCRTECPRTRSQWAQNPGPQAQDARCAERGRTHLRGALHNLLALQRGHVVRDLGREAAVVHHQHLQLLQVVHHKLVEACARSRRATSALSCMRLNGRLRRRTPGGQKDVYGSIGLTRTVAGEQVTSFACPHSWAACRQKCHSSAVLAAWAVQRLPVTRSSLGACRSESRGQQGRTAGQQVPRLLVRPVADVGHDHAAALELTPHARVDTPLAPPGLLWPAHRRFDPALCLAAPSTTAARPAASPPHAPPLRVCTFARTVASTVASTFQCCTALGAVDTLARPLAGCRRFPERRQTSVLAYRRHLRS